MGRRKKNINKEAIAEDWCFECKDGGVLRVCDYKDCLKAFHPQCVEKDDSFLESEVPWSCRWHFCFICKNPSKLYCFCCPKAVCGRCLCDAEFTVVRGTRGLCGHCLTLAGILEGIKGSDSAVENVDFNVRDTYEFNFKGYWEVIKQKEGLTSRHVSFAKNLLNVNENYGDLSDFDDPSEMEEDVSEFEEDQNLSDKDVWSNRRKRKRKVEEKRGKGNQCMMKRKPKSKEKEFSGWGSKLLLNFLGSIGKDTTIQLSQREVSDIIIGYCNENKLYDPNKKKKVVCDARLKSLLGRKSVSKNSIYKRLTIHFAENVDQSEDEIGYSSEDESENVLMACKRQKISSSNRMPQNEESIPDVRQGCFAAINAENIKLLYLKRSLIEELAKQPETFDAKVVGSFVRTRSDPNDYLQKNLFQLLKVTGVNRGSRNGEVNTDTLLEVSNMPKDVPICKLSDDNFSEEECEDLRQRVKGGQLKKLTFVEFKEKARSLHEAITKHWIAKELALLQNRIDQANEKGWRKELSYYMERMLLLRTSSEQSRLLLEVPEIIADESEVEPDGKDLPRMNERENVILPEPGLKGFSNSSSRSPGHKGMYYRRKRAADFAEQKQLSKGPESEELVQPIRGSNCDGNGNFYILQTQCGDSDKVKKFNSEASQPQPVSGPSLASSLQGHSNSPLLKNQQFPGNATSEDKQDKPASSSQGHANSPLLEHQHCPGNAISEDKQDKPADAEHENVKNNQNAKFMETMTNNHSSVSREIIQLSDDEEQDESSPSSKQTPDSLNSPTWYCLSPLGIKLGPCSMSVLKTWSDTCPYDMKFKVWKIGQDPKEAVFLTDAIHQVFVRK